MEAVVGSKYPSELRFILELIKKSGELARGLFHSDEFKVFTKEDGTKVTSIDLAVSKHVITAATKKGIKVRSEEEGSTARYGENGVLDLDPIDSTGDLIEGYGRRPRRANAAPSLRYWNRGPVAGAATFPLLGVPAITYLASEGGGAYREQRGSQKRLEVDSTPTRGIVFVSSKTHTPAAQAMTEMLRKMRYTPVPEHGAVFKACCVVDRELSRQYPHNKVHDSGIPVVGFLSKGVYLHDIAVVTCIVREAGGFASTPLNKPGKQSWGWRPTTNLCTMI